LTFQSVEPLSSWQDHPYREVDVITRTFKVAEIHCASCENTIRTALSRLPGVGVVVPSSAGNDVKVSFDDAKVTEEQLRARLAEVGFEPES
jgi:copper chaperone CopZ